MTQDDIHRILDKAASQAGMELRVIDSDRGMYALMFGEVAIYLHCPAYVHDNMVKPIFFQAFRDVYRAKADHVFETITVFEAK